MWTALAFVAALVFVPSAQAASDPDEADGFVQVSAGAYHSVALKADGTVWTWGSDSGGQLGDGMPLASQPEPVQVLGLANIHQVAAGFQHSVALKSDGTVWTWGSDTYGQLGDGLPLASKAMPVQVAGLTNVRQIAAGSCHTVALRADGTVWAWGSDGDGELGNDAALLDKSAPVPVAGLTNVRQVSGGDFHTVAVKDDGTVWAWGSDFKGQLGDDAPLVDHHTPVLVAGVTNVRQVAAGDLHTVAVKADGTVWSWGSDSSGQLGDDAALVDHHTPVLVAGVTNVRQVAAGSNHSIVVEADGTAWTWGNDDGGQLGDDATLADQPTPVAVAWSAPCGFVQIAAGYGHTVAVKADGTVWTWGNDEAGQLGNDVLLSSRSTPVQVAGLTNVRQVSAGISHAVALKADGTVWTWGSDSDGQLGDGMPLTSQPEPVQVAGLTDVRQVAAGYQHTVAVKADGTVWNWGADDEGQLGDGAIAAYQPTPVLVAGLTGVSQVAAGGWHTVVVKVDGSVWAWGWDQYGQLGNDVAHANEFTPVPVAGLTEVRQVAAGGWHTVAVKDDGTVWTWGSDDVGQLGDGASLIDQPTPVLVTGLFDAWQVAAGFGHTVALKADGTVWTWGNDEAGQLGNDTGLVNQPTPVSVAGPPNMRQIAAGYQHSVALKANGAIWTWGSDEYGQLGDDPILADQPLPVQAAACVVGDSTAPTPNPSTGSASADSDTQITWTIDPATDSDSGLAARAYSFDNGVSWQVSNVLVQTGLSASTQYTKTMRVRDASGNLTTGTAISRYT